MTATGTVAPAPVPLAARLRTLAIVVVTAVAIGGLAWVINNPTADGYTEIQLAGAAGEVPRAGSVPPAFETIGTDGKEFSLAAYAGKPIWLTFGASWCADCRTEAADLQATYAAFKDRGLVVLGVFIQEDVAAVEEYAGRVGFTFPRAADPQARIAAAYRTLGIPTHFFIGADGTIREVRIGALDRAEMDRLVGLILD